MEGGITQDFGYLLGFFLRRVFEETGTAGINAECIVSQKAIVAHIFHYVESLVSFQLPFVRWNVISSSNPLAMPRSTKSLLLPSLRGSP